MLHDRLICEALFKNAHSVPGGKSCTELDTIHTYMNTGMILFCVHISDIFFWKTGSHGVFRRCAHFILGSVALYSLLAAKLTLWYLRSIMQRHLCNKEYFQFLALQDLRAFSKTIYMCL